MTWPTLLVDLLARSSSPEARALRWGLHGLRATLQAALTDVPASAVGPELQELIGELTVLLEREGQAPAPTLPADGAAEQRAGNESDGPRLRSLALAIVKDARLAAELAESPLDDSTDAEIWSSIHRLLLRVPAGVAEEWRRRAQELAEQAGGRLDEWAAVPLPLPWDQSIYPGVTGAIRAPGLRSDPTTPLDPRVAPPPDAAPRELAGIVSACLWLVNHDPHLKHCLKAVFRFGLSPLSGEQGQRYQSELLRLWERVCTAAAGPSNSARPQARDLLQAVLDLDEAIHSLVFQPLAAADSWWARFQSQARTALFEARDRAIAAGCAVHLQVLGGSFADINRLAPDSLQIDCGIPGEVSTCLRVWARIDGEELKGRVLYRSPQEDV
jgi:hypothetical protein